MKARFYLSTPVLEEAATLADSEAHHLLHVMRAKPGDEITLFDGSGMEYRAEVLTCGRNSVDLRILDSSVVDRESACAVTIAVALPKGDRQKFLVEKTVELGVRRLVPLVTERSVAQPNAKALDRLRRAIMEASKQCGRNVLMDVSEARPFDDFVHDSFQQQLKLIGHPGHPDGLPQVSARQVDSVVAMIGPEGGFSQDEIETARSQGWQCVNLGRRILRVETAAILVASAFCRD